MWLLSIRRMDLEDVESTESFYFLLKTIVFKCATIWFFGSF